MSRISPFKAVSVDLDHAWCYAETTLTILISALVMGIEAETWNPNSGEPKPPRGP